MGCSEIHQLREMLGQCQAMTGSFVPLNSGHIPLHRACLGLRRKGQFQHLIVDSFRLLAKSFQILLRDGCQTICSRKQDSLLRHVIMVYPPVNESFYPYKSMFFTGNVIVPMASVVKELCGWSYSIYRVLG